MQAGPVLLCSYNGCVPQINAMHEKLVPAAACESKKLRLPVHV